MNIDKAEKLLNELKKMALACRITNQLILPHTVNFIKKSISSLTNECEKEHSIIAKHLNDLSRVLFYGYNNVFQVNLITCGQIIILLEYLHEMYFEKKENVWFCIHPQIIKSSKQLYLDKHYSNAVLNAFKEINSRMKKIYQILNPETKSIPDGVNLMNIMLSYKPEKNPMLKINDMNTETNKNIQTGFQFMLSGAISALRNPLAHSNDEKLDAEESMRQLMFASMLMYKIDEAIKNTGIPE